MRVKCRVFFQERKALYERIRSRPLQTCFLILHFKTIEWISGSADKDRKAVISGFYLYLAVICSFREYRGLWLRGPGICLERKMPEKVFWQQRGALSSGVLKSEKVWHRNTGGGLRQVSGRFSFDRCCDTG